ncbi:uncharacterized protein ATNIH1004_005483 [Aspergillus tanneri]|uniref:Uncharacterized protein n=1 Tax=Aspergillus tanneri TaxID=1220188 RepID=A0A5M9MIJ3_9EURO|nr:uncharacterized protein ATNIH1004_005483 [Aspergillus tanneri]KAA8646808.1 hypothetical protein ATNIH1004_005483 [Aspergillus tanneri]
MWPGTKGEAASTSLESQVLSGTDRDDANLAQIGKKAVLKRNFGLLSILGFSCTIIATWEGLLDTFIIPLKNGGPAGAIYAYIVAWIGTGCSFVVLSELSSMAPTSGGWVTLIGWQAAFASVSYLAGTEVQGAVIFAHSHYNPKPWHGTFLLWAVVLVAVGVNVVGGKFFPRLETLILFLHLGGFLAIVVALTSKADHKSAREVFTDFRNGGHLPTDGISFFVGMIGCVFAFAGGDAAVHVGPTHDTFLQYHTPQISGTRWADSSQMAEECNNAAVAIPRAIILSVAINGTLGFSILVAVLFCMGDVQEALDSPTGYPYFEIFHQAMGTTSGGLGLSAVLVSSYTHLPIYSILVTMTIACLLGLINIGSSVALNGVLSMAVSGLYLSYLIVAAMLLYRRCTGAVADLGETDGMQKNVPGAKLVWGPFHVPGAWGIIVNGYAVIHMTIVVFFSFWPTEIPVHASNMNFSVVGTMGTILLAVAYYVLRAHRFYHGPVIEITAQ